MATVQYTSPAEFEEAYKTLNATYGATKTKNIKWRKWQLKQFWWMIEENEERFLTALNKDLNRHAFESLVMELRAIRGDIIDMLEYVDQWAAGEKPDAGFFMGTLGKAWLRKEPLGVALIIGAWNFPAYTLLSPVIAAIAAGNCVIMKPSELATSCQALLAELVPKYLDQSAIRIVTGAAAETSHMLSFKFNIIFYTGGGIVGRIIAAAAAKHLTPVVLELGGQAPVIVGKSANIDLSAKRIAHAKITNAGQVCLNANHIFADPAVYDQLIERMAFWFDKFLEKGDGELAHIINDRHFDRVAGLLKGTRGTVAYGGESDRASRFIAPTIVRDVTTSDSLMSEEIFGPIAPVLKADVSQAIRVINSMPHPLGLYIFSSDQAEIDRILYNTTSGGVTVNDVAIHAGVPQAPFGGVGESGYGSYHGKYGFDAFSHTRTVVTFPTWLEVAMSWRYAPYKMENAKMVALNSKIVGKPGQTMEEQTVGRPASVSGVIVKALAVVAVVAALDSASGGKLLLVQTVQDAVGKVWSK